MVSRSPVERVNRLGPTLEAKFTFVILQKCRAYLAFYVDPPGLIRGPLQLSSGCRKIVGALEAQCSSSGFSSGDQFVLDKFRLDFLVKTVVTH